ncbi:MAG: DUF4783 domain-containing protein [Prolixibacteraceae bacterium]|jgi:hypothetical protein|nr:DUF4783 domain-containing protein [Prolixibacteraceae bacterium]
MVKVIKNIVLVLAVMFAVSTVGNAQNIPDYVIVSLKTGNAQQLSKNFSDNIELVILDDDNVYSKAHAQQVIADFFKKYPPQDFSLIYQGGKEESSYAIGNLQVQNEKFRVYFLVKTKNGSSQIHQLRIERQTK